MGDAQFSAGRGNGFNSWLGVRSPFRFKFAFTILSVMATPLMYAFSTVHASMQMKEGMWRPLRRIGMRPQQPGIDDAIALIIEGLDTA